MGCIGVRVFGLDSAFRVLGFHAGLWVFGLHVGIRALRLRFWHGVQDVRLNVLRLGCGVWDLWFRVCASVLRFRVWDLNRVCRLSEPVHNDFHGRRRFAVGLKNPYLTNK